LGKAQEAQKMNPPEQESSLIETFLDIAAINARVSQRISPIASEALNEARTSLSKGDIDKAKKLILALSQSEHILDFFRNSAVTKI